MPVRKPQCCSRPVPADARVPRRRATSPSWKRWAKRPCSLKIVRDRPASRIGITIGHRAPFDLDQREQPALDRASRHLNGQFAGVLPAQRARAVYTQESRPLDPHCVAHLALQVLREGHRGRGGVGNVMSRDDRQQVLLEMPLAHPLFAGGRGGRRGASAASRTTAGSRCSCRLRCRSRHRGCCDSAPASPKAPEIRCHRCRHRRRRPAPWCSCPSPSSPLPCPKRRRRRFRTSECTQGTRQADCGQAW